MLTALLWCDKMYKNIGKKLLHLTIEFFQLGKENEKRLTNAERLRTAFALHPATTTLLLDKKLNPYLNRMKNRNGMDSQRYAMMQELLHKIGTENFTNKRLGELYLVGYADQMMDFKAENAEYKAKAKKQEE